MFALSCILHTLSENRRIESVRGGRGLTRSGFQLATFSQTQAPTVAPFLFRFGFPLVPRLLPFLGAVSLGARSSRSEVL